MARIIDTGITLTSSSPTAIFLLLGADIRFTASEVDDGRAGRARFELECIVWDDDAVFNDRIASRRRVIAPDSFQRTVGVELEFRLDIDHLRSKEGPFEQAIELFGEFIVRKDGSRIAPTVKGRNLNYRFPRPPADQPSGGSIT